MMLSYCDGQQQESIMQVKYKSATRPLRDPGDDLLSHIVSHVVPLALKGLTSVFGKGTGVSPSLKPPEIHT